MEEYLPPELECVGCLFRISVWLNVCLSLRLTFSKVTQELEDYDIQRNKKTTMQKSIHNILWQLKMSGSYKLKVLGPFHLQAQCIQKVQRQP